MKRSLTALALCLGMAWSMGGAQAQRPKVLVFYSLNVENDHVLFALDALRFYADLAQKDNFTLEATTNLEELNDKNLQQYQLVIWLNTFAHSQAEREAFERYLSTGGAWFGFHVCLDEHPVQNGLYEYGARRQNLHQPGSEHDD